MVTEVVHQSWFSRLGKSIVGVLFGLLFFIGAIILLAWNEGRALKTETGLKEGVAQVVSLESSTPDPARDEHLVHVSGEAVTQDELSDPFFKVRVRAIKLRRSVEMFQWKENSREESKTNLGGSTDTTTTYSYEKVWSEDLIPSGNFHDKSHKNPSTMPLESQHWTANPVTLGGFNLNEELVDEMDHFEGLTVPEILPKGYQSVGDTIYKSNDPDSPEIGSLRIKLAEVKSALVSVIALQQGTNLQSYETETGTTLNMLVYGKVPAPQMFADAQRANAVVTWLLRLGGFVLLFLAGILVLAPVGVLADVIPFLGSIARFGTSLLALLWAIPIWFVTVALAWIAYRPLLGLTLLVLGIGIPIGLFMIKRRKIAPPPVA